ncbi:permease prefix domain 1-containing protein [Jeotgalibaca sp. A122]|uniref:permease prefix domain 1-containing protein n=1 Tax=Jeotgalibaca sp. A122 TaxID=3457322 RepID=UPI003FD0C364
MNMIHSYVDSVFEKLPKNQEMNRLKAEMLASMEEKYRDLIEQGTTENEAIGTVLAEFGNIDEIIEAYNLEIDEQEYDPDVIVMSRSEVDNYLFHRQKFSLAMATGVFLCIISVAFLFLSMVIGSLLNRGASNDVFALVGTVLMLLTIAMGIGLFIIFGMQESSYPFDKKILRLDPATYAEVKAQYEIFKQKLSYAIAAGVISCILGPVFLLLSIVFLGEDNMISIVFLMSFIAVGVFLFVYYGIQNDTFEKLLTMGSHTRAQVISNKYSERISAVIFPLATLFYLYQGFVNGAWGTAWIVFPIVGIGFGILTTVITGIANLTDKKK